MADKPDSDAELKARALRHLVRREHSRAELARKLAPHAGSPQALESVLDLLLSKKQQSDERFASERARVLSRKYGASKIRHDLRARGVADDVIERVFSDDELERARAILERKFPLKPQSREESVKRARFLQSRGFSYDVIRSLLKELGSPYPAVPICRRR